MQMQLGQGSSASMPGASVTDKKVIDETRALFRARPRTVTIDTISVATELPKVWLQDFQYSRTSNPRVDRVLVLREYLQGLSSELGADNV